jgi:adenylylsulfate kinase
MDTNQTGFAIWLTGLPSSGKTTLAWALAEWLQRQKAVNVQILDSDELRRQLTPNPRYSAMERDWFYDTIVWLAKMLTGNGVNVIIAATGPLRRYRQDARNRIDRFAEVYVICAPEICRERDPKGLWARADRGEISNLPGADAPYEPPQPSEVTVRTDTLSVAKGVQYITNRLRRQGFF